MNYLITGGVRSGKSAYAQTLAISLSPSPYYLATSRVWDEDFSRRIERHKTDRDRRWNNLEIEKYISKIDLTGEVIVIDCITLWLTNFFSDHKYDLEKSLEESKIELEKLLQVSNSYLFITNEIGSGGHAETEIGRKFADLQGWFNQFLASKVDRVVFMVSGIAMTIKP